MAGCDPDPIIAMADDIAAACIQAAASVNAAELQAKAALAAGYMTLAAGVLAVIAAVIGAVVACRSVRDQIEATKALQVEDQRYTVKRDVYLAASSGLYSGVWAITRFADPTIPIAKALELYHAQTSGIAKVNLVGPPSVMEAVMNASLALSDAHLEALEYRLDFDRRAPQSTDEIFSLGLFCQSKLQPLIRQVIPAVVAMRRDISLPVEQAVFEQLATSAIDRAASNAAAAMKRMNAKLSCPPVRR